MGFLLCIVTLLVESTVLPTPQRPSDNPTNPHEAHYDTLEGKEVEAVPSPIEKSYTSSTALTRSTSSQNMTSTRNEASIPATYETSQRSGRSKAEGGQGEGRKMSFNTTLDNCIILEDFIKELLIIMSARRAFGIAPVSLEERGVCSEINVTCMTF